MQKIILEVVGWIIMITAVIVWIKIFRKVKRLESTNDLDGFTLNLKVLIDAAVIVFLALIGFLVVARLTFAAENSAPVEPPAVAEKSAASCPTEFNIDDSAWAMREINSVPQKVHELYIERVRVFSYLPDPNPEKRIFIGIKNLWNPDCVAKLGSYSSYDFADGKRVWGIIQTPGKTTFFLLQNNNSPLDLKTLLRSKPDVWQSGDRITGTFTCENIKECNITFVLYKENVPIALRKLLLPIE